MDSFIVTYDLVGTSETSADYRRLIERIKSYHWGKLQKSAWIVCSSKSAPAIRDHLVGAMDGNDRLLVGKLTGAAAWHNPLCTNE